MRMATAFFSRTGQHALSAGQNPEQGHIYVVDVAQTTPPSATFRTKIADVIAVDVPALAEPYGVTATKDPGIVTFTNRLADSRGFGIIKATNPTATTFSVDWSQLILGSPTDVLDVNNGQAIAILPANTLGTHPDYAFVTGFNRYIQGDASHDPDLNPTRGAGGNVGIIRDPFTSSRKLVAVTRMTPEFSDNLTLSADGKFLVRLIPALAVCLSSMFRRLSTPLIPLILMSDGRSD
jgi:hypothetical protein